MSYAPQTPPKKPLETLLPVLKQRITDVVPFDGIASISYKPRHRKEASKNIEAAVMFSDQHFDWDKEVIGTLYLGVRSGDYELTNDNSRKAVYGLLQTVKGEGEKVKWFGYQVKPIIEASENLRKIFERVDTNIETIGIVSDYITSRMALKPQ